MSSPRGAAVTRAAAALCAGLALLAYAAVLLLGSRVGWVVYVGGGEFIPADEFDVRGDLPWFAVLVAAVLVGAWLAARRPRHPIPWLLVALGLGFLAYPVVVLTVTVATADGEIGAWVPYVAWTSNWVWLVGQVGAIYLLLLFPDGRPLNHRWRVVARGIGVYLALMFVLLALFPEVELGAAFDNPFGVAVLGRVGWVLMPLILVGFFLAQGLPIVALVVRFVRSTGVERQQMKWMALGAVGLGLMIPAGLLDAPRWVQAVPSALLLAAIVVAITRYRLYEIDRVVSRTVSYALVTLVLAGVYLTGVLGIGALVRGLAPGAGNDLVVAASTLAVAALFRPVRRRIQSVTDRRFNRSRYDAERTVERFAQRLRDEVDLAEIRTDLRDVVTACVEPTSVSTWFPGRDAAG